VQFDGNIRNAIRAHEAPLLTSALKVMSFIGEWYVIVPLSLIVVVFLHFRLRRHALLFAIVMAVALVIEEGLKPLFHRPRPEPFPEFNYPTPNSYSFPSGHALFSVVFFGTAAALISSSLQARWKKTLLWLAAAFMAASIGFSRVYLGVHFPTDVMAGYATALVWVLSVAIGNSIRGHHVQ
jgi:undecaprenyl-diphosphatase